MPVPWVSVPDMDTALILHAAELEAPSLRATARRTLEAEAGRFGIWLDTGDVLPRRAERRPEPHLMAAAEELVAHLAAAGGGPRRPERSHGAGTPRRRGAGEQCRGGRGALASGRRSLVGECQLDDRCHQDEDRTDLEDGPDPGAAQVPRQLDGILAARLPHGLQVARV